MFASACVYWIEEAKLLPSFDTRKLAEALIVTSPVISLPVKLKFLSAVEPLATKLNCTSPVLTLRLGGGGVAELSICRSSSVHLAPSSLVEV